MLNSICQSLYFIFVCFSSKKLHWKRFFSIGRKNERKNEREETKKKEEKIIFVVVIGNEKDKKKSYFKIGL